MKVISWNVNGIRSLKKSTREVLSDLSADLVCFQETKVSRAQLPETTAFVSGFSSYFSYPRKQSGYSGVATYCNSEFSPEEAEEGFSSDIKSKQELFPENLLDDISQFDPEGRVMITYHLVRYENDIRRIVLINIYCPRVDPDKPERQLYKMQFCYLLEAKVRELCKSGCSVIIVGDWNIAYSTVDHCDPGDQNEFNSSESRQWMNAFLSCNISSCNGSVRMVDAFRHLHPHRLQAYTCWNTRTSARLTNFGTRIDYFLLTSDLLPLLRSCDILADHPGSDHCPISLVIGCEGLKEVDVQLPPICTKFWPEFSGRQQTLKNFFQKRGREEVGEEKAIVKKKPKQKSITNFFTNQKSEAVSDSSSSTKTTSVKPYSTSITLHVPVTQSTNSSSNTMSFEPNVTSTAQSTNSPSNTISSEPNSTSIVQSNNSNSKPSSIEPLTQSDFDSDALPSSNGSQNNASAWKTVLTGPPKPPLCKGHKKECVLRTVKKKGANYGRQFFMCSLPAGHTSNPDASCDFFQWAFATKSSKLK